jgi:hypothetical protein
MAKDYRRKSWSEKLAVAGAIAAIVAAIAAVVAIWPLPQLIENRRINSEISLIDTTASQFDPLVQEYIQLVHNGDPKAKGFADKHRNDAVWSRMNELIAMSFTQWPSKEAYDAFQQYYVASTTLLETSVDVNRSIIVQDHIKAYDGKLATLQQALNNARR